MEKEIKAIIETELKKSFGFEKLKIELEESLMDNLIEKFLFWFQRRKAKRKIELEEVLMDNLMKKLLE